MKQKPLVVVFTGAGISAESGIKTFRDTGGLWEQYNIEEVATPEAWKKNPSLVLEFYNQRRKQILEAKPNPAHKAIKELESKYNVIVITQNIDNFHERAGSENVLHLHGEIIKARSTMDASLIYAIEGWELKLGEKCKYGSQLRPHIVWFGEAVPNMDRAYNIAAEADIFIVVGTSLNVYPAAGLIHLAPSRIPKYLVDPNGTTVTGVKNLEVINEKASTGLTALAEKLLQ